MEIQTHLFQIITCPRLASFWGHILQTHIQLKGPQICFCLRFISSLCFLSFFFLHVLGGKKKQDRSCFKPHTLSPATI